MNADTQVEVFFDGQCPLCQREISFLRRWDGQGRILFSDITDPSFEASDLGLDTPTLMAEIHGRLPDGKIIKGVEVFRRLYSAVGFSWIVAPTRLPGIRHLLDAAYGLFACNRLRLTGRCEANQCHVE